MGLLRIHSLIRRRRRRGLALVAVVAVAGAFAVHHVGPVVGASMGGGHHEIDLGPVAELCLGVLTAVGAALATAALVVLAPRRRRAPLALVATGVAEQPAPAPRPPRARAGGVAFLCVMRC